MKSVWFYYIQTFKDICKNLSVLATLILSLFFYSIFYPTAYKAQVADFLPIVIVDEQPSILTSKIINSVSESPNVDVYAVVANFETAKALVQAQKADAILYLPNNLAQSIRRGENSGVGLYLNATNFVAAKQSAAGIAVGIEQVIFNYFQPILDSNLIRTPSIPIHKVPLFNVIDGYGSYVFPAIAPLIVHQTIFLGLGILIAAYVRDKKWTGDPKQYLGVFLMITTIGCLGAFYLFGFAFWFNGYPNGGNLWGMLLATPIFVACVVTFALLVASFLDCPERIGHIWVPTSVPIFMLSGTSWPHSAMPTWIEYFAISLPSTQGIQMFIQLNQMGVPTDLIIPRLLYLLLLTAIFTIFSYYRLVYKFKNVL